MHLLPFCSLYIDLDFLVLALCLLRLYGSLRSERRLRLHCAVLQSGVLRLHTSRNCLSLISLRFYRAEGLQRLRLCLGCHLSRHDDWLHRCKRREQHALSMLRGFWT